MPAIETTKENPLWRVSAWVPTDISRINSGRNRLDVIDVRSNITLGSINKLCWHHSKSQHRVTFLISRSPCLWLINIAFTTAKSEGARSLLILMDTDIDSVFYPTELQLSHTDTAGRRVNLIRAYKMLLTKAVYVAIIYAFCGWKPSLSLTLVWCFLSGLTCIQMYPCCNLYIIGIHKLYSTTQYPYTEYNYHIIDIVRNIAYYYIYKWYYLKWHQYNKWSDVQERHLSIHVSIHIQICDFVVCLTQMRGIVYTESKCLRGLQFKCSWNFNVV